VSVVALASAKGAPGVTTAAVALGGVWPSRALLVECDPAGGDLAARFELAATPGLVSLASETRRGLRAEQLWLHAQRLPGGLPVLLGVGGPEQARALGPLWSLLPQALAQAGGDVVVDCGRVGPDSPVAPLLHAADLVVLLARPTVEGVAHLELRLHALERDQIRPAVVLVGERPFDRRTVQARLAADGLHAKVLGALADDRDAAAVLCGQPGPSRGLGRSRLVRSARVLVEALLVALPGHACEQRTNPGRTAKEAGHATG